MTSMTENENFDQPKQNERKEPDKTRIQKLAAQLTRDREKTSRKRKVKRLIYSLLTLLAMVAVWYIWKAYEPIQVTSSVVSYQRVGITAQPVLRLSGYVTYPRVSTISATAQTPVTRLTFNVGDNVQQGALLAEFDNTELVNKRQIQEITIRNLEEILTRTKNLHLTGGASEADLQQTENQLELAQASLNLLNTQINNRTILAPFSGLIIDKMVEIGEMAIQGICRLADDSSVLAEVDVNQEDFTKINENQSAAVILDGYPGMEYAADIYQIMPSANLATNTVNVKVRLLNPDSRFKPNMSVKVFFIDQEVFENTPVKAVLTVERTAVIENDGETVVWLIQNGRVRERIVELGKPIGGRQMEVISGIEPNQRVILNPQSHNLKPGDRVQIL